MMIQSSVVPVRIGFIPLTDAAAVIAAARKGFGARHGLSMDLSRENSWASLRDKLVVGLLDAAHVLAPLALATHIGLGHVQKTLIAPMRLSLDGNVIAASNALYAILAAVGYAGVAEDLPAALARALPLHRASAKRPLTLATVFPASSHHALLRRILREAALNEGSDAQLVVLAPHLMVEALGAGVIDGFCVGAPWGGHAVARGVGHIVATSAEFASGRTEKLLAMTEDWAGSRPDVALRLVAAIAEAGRWCADPANRAELAALLAAPDVIGLPAPVIERSLAGMLVRHPGAAPARVASFIALGGDAVSRPDPSGLASIIADLGEAPPATAAALLGSFLRPEIFDRALATLADHPVLPAN